MTYTHFLLAVGLFLVAGRLWPTLNRVAPGVPRVTLWIIAIGLLAALVFRTVRTARGLRTMSVQEAERAVYSLAFLGLVLISLALSVPDFFVR